MCIMEKWNRNKNYDKYQDRMSTLGSPMGSLQNNNLLIRLETNWWVGRRHFNDLVSEENHRVSSRKMTKC